MPLPFVSLVGHVPSLSFGAVWWPAGDGPFWGAVALAAALSLAAAIAWQTYRQRALVRLRHALDIYAEREIARRRGRAGRAPADAETAWGGAEATAGSWQPRLDRSHQGGGCR